MNNLCASNPCCPGMNFHENLTLFFNHLGWSKYVAKYDRDAVDRLFMVYALHRNDLNSMEAQVVKDAMLNPAIKLSREWYNHLSIETLCRLWEIMVQDTWMD